MIFGATSDIEDSIKAGTPYFALNLNKIIGWKPINLSGKRPEKVKFNNAGDFVKDATYFDCAAVDRDGKELVNATYGIEYVGNNDGINGKGYFTSEGFPYLGAAAYSNGKKNSNLPYYYKPFVLMKMKNDGKNKILIFRCSVFLDNINSLIEKCLLP